MKQDREEFFDAIEAGNRLGLGLIGFGFITGFGSAYLGFVEQRPAEALQVATLAAVMLFGGLAMREDSHRAFIHDLRHGGRFLPLTDDSSETPTSES